MDSETDGSNLWCQYSQWILQWFPCLSHMRVAGILFDELHNGQYQAKLYVFYKLDEWEKRPYYVYSLDWKQTPIKN